MKKTIIYYLVVQVAVAVACYFGGFDAQINLAHLTGLMTMGISIFLVVFSFKIPERKESILTCMSGLLMATGYFLYIFLHMTCSSSPIDSLIFDAASTLSLAGNIWLIELLRRR